VRVPPFLPPPDDEGAEVAVEPPVVVAVELLDDELPHADRRPRDNVATAARASGRRGMRCDTRYILVKWA
jgi:hypothetical protein